MRTLPPPRKRSEFASIKNKVRAPLYAGPDYQQMYSTPHFISRGVKPYKAKAIGDKSYSAAGASVNYPGGSGNLDYTPLKERIRYNATSSNQNSPRDVTSDYSDNVPISQKILEKLQTVNLNGYDYDKPGSLTMAYRVPENLVGQGLREATKQTVQINNELLSQKQEAFNQSSKAPSAISSMNSKFPKTTNQEFHNMSTWQKQVQISKKESRFNYKKQSPFSSYVDAMFNNGVYLKPTIDQL